MCKSSVYIFAVIAVGLSSVHAGYIGHAGAVLGHGLSAGSLAGPALSHTALPLGTVLHGVSAHAIPAAHQFGITAAHGITGLPGVSAIHGLTAGHGIPSIHGLTAAHGISGVHGIPVYGLASNGILSHGLLSHGISTRAVSHPALHTSAVYSTPYIHRRVHPVAPAIHPAHGILHAKAAIHHAILHGITKGLLH